MKIIMAVAVCLTLLVDSSVCYAGNHIEHIDVSGDAGARLGTMIYNAMNKDRPLPLESDDVIEKTIQNMGAGKSFDQAWADACADASGLNPQFTHHTLHDFNPADGPEDVEVAARAKALISGLDKQTSVQQGGARNRMSGPRYDSVGDRWCWKNLDSGEEHCDKFSWSAMGFVKAQP